ncbi:hypothetical protein ACN38_g7437 [Penicillium nordicum]|uniref:Uncharacterized protein n=1 Tax=Penicillium nordicum TaxID=229535 RepID=A0A0M8P6H5_9EURO|nr:hypothetical protein ACN38_g7437 [Penicillium nordicum]
MDVDECHRVEKSGSLFLFITKFCCGWTWIIPNSLMVGHTNSDVEMIPNCLTGNWFFSENIRRVQEIFLLFIGLPCALVF